MIINQEQLSLEFNDNVKFDYDLKKKNWFNIGGKAKIYFKADNLKDLIKFFLLIMLIFLMIMRITQQR